MYYNYTCTFTINCTVEGWIALLYRMLSKLGFSKLFNNAYTSYIMNIIYMYVYMIHIMYMYIIHSQMLRIVCCFVTVSSALIVVSYYNHLHAKIHNYCIMLLWLYVIKTDVQFTSDINLYHKVHCLIEAIAINCSVKYTVFSNIKVHNNLVLSFACFIVQCTHVHVTGPMKCVLEMFSLVWH